MSLVKSVVAVSSSLLSGDLNGLKLAGFLRFLRGNRIMAGTLLGVEGRRKHVLLETKNKTWQGLVILCTSPEDLAQMHILA